MLDRIIIPCGYGLVTGSSQPLSCVLASTAQPSFVFVELPDNVDVANDMAQSDAVIVFFIFIYPCLLWNYPTKWKCKRQI